MRQGTLYLSATHVEWRPTWSLSRPRLAIDLPAKSVTVRPASSSEPNLKKGGFRGFVPTFVVVAAALDRGVLEFGVPELDAPLVASALGMAGDLGPSV